MAVLLYCSLTIAVSFVTGCHGSTDISEASTAKSQSQDTLTPIHSTAVMPSTSSALPITVVPDKFTPTVQRVNRPEFDAENAFASLVKQCDFGPRPLGSEAHEKTKVYLLKQMKQYADVTIEQSFNYRGMPVTNVIGVFYPAGASAPAKNPVLLLTHWDSRPIADGPSSSEALKSPAFRYGPNGWNRTTPIIAANDGASGTAVLLQLAHMFKHQKPPVGVILLLDDGEDYGDFRANNNAGEGVELGSRYFAKHFKEDSRLGFPDYGILLDMIGGKDLMLPAEKFSAKDAPGTLMKVFQAGKALGYKNVFRDDLEISVDDDHIALNRAGMHVIDLIPFFGDTAPQGVAGYNFWHTLQDTPDKCSPNALKIVGETIAEVIYNETPAP